MIPYYFHLTHEHLNINWAITAESSPHHKTSDQTQERLGPRV